MSWCFRQILIKAYLEILLVLVRQRVVDLLDPPVRGDVVALRLRVEVNHHVLPVRHRLHHPKQVQQRLVQINLRKKSGKIIWKVNAKKKLLALPLQHTRGRSTPLQKGHQVQVIIKEVL